MTTLAVRPGPGQADVGRELTELALAGAGWGTLLERLAAAIGRTCRLVAPDGAVLASSDGGAGLSPLAAGRALRCSGASVTAQDGWAGRALAARAGDRLHALLLVAEPAHQPQLELAGTALTALLIEAVRRTASGTSRFDDGATVIAALRTGHPDQAAITTAAARFALDLTQPACAAVLRYTGRHQRTWATALSWLERPVQQQGSDAYCLVRDDADLTRVRQQLELAVGTGTVLAGCGPVTDCPDGYRESFRTARALLTRVPQSGQLAFADAGLLQVLLVVPPERLSYFVERHLGPVLARPELLATLRLWLATQGSRQAVSEQLHLHRNSVGYRVGQLKSLLGVDPLEPSTSAVLQAALLANDLLDQESPCPIRAIDKQGTAP